MKIELGARSDTEPSAEPRITPYVAEALPDSDLSARVAAHRVVFFRKSQEAQASLQPGRLRLMPPTELRSAWKQDYDAMRESMFFGEAPTFDDILTVVAAFERRFNATPGPASPLV